MFELINPAAAFSWFLSSARQKLGWIIICMIYLTIIHQILKSVNLTMTYVIDYTASWCTSKDPRRNMNPGVHPMILDVIMKTKFLMRP